MAELGDDPIKAVAEAAAAALDAAKEAAAAAKDAADAAADAARAAAKAQPVPDPIDPHPLVEALAINARAGAALTAQERAEILEYARSNEERRCFVGYLGPLIDDQQRVTGKTWQVLYLEETLSAWLVVEKGSILKTTRQTDPKAPFGYHDWMWVSGDAQIREGTGSARTWLSGSFTRASGFTPSVEGGTFEQPTGPFCGTGCTRLSRYPR
jgi:hypothetical protein